MQKCNNSNSDNLSARQMIIYCRFKYQLINNLFCLIPYYDESLTNELFFIFTHYDELNYWYIN